MAKPSREAVDKTTMKINGKWSWLYAAIDFETKLILHVQLFGRHANDPYATFRSKDREKHNVFDVTAPVAQFRYWTALSRLVLNVQVDHARLFRRDQLRVCRARSNTAAVDEAQKNKIHLPELYFLNTVSLLEVFGVDRVRSTVHNWVHKVDLQPESDQSPNHVAIDETVIQFDDKQYWLYAAVDPVSINMVYTTLGPTRTNVIADQFFSALREKHDVENAIFLVDVAVSLQRICEKQGLDFWPERRENQNIAVRVVYKIKIRTICFSKLFQQRRSRNC